MIRSFTIRAGALLALAAAGPAQALDLEAALREVAAANPTLAARRAMVEAAERRAPPAGAWQSAMLELGAINVPASGRLDMDPMTMRMVGITQRVPVFGGNRLNGRSARSAADAEGAASELAHYELFGGAWEAYADAFYADQLVRSAAGHEQDMDRLIRSARVRYDSGNGRLEDVLRAEAERARTRADQASFQAEARGAHARLDALMGRTPGASTDTLAPPPAVTVPADPRPWLAAVAPAHPRLRETRAQVERYRLAARAARRMAWPDLEVHASYGFRRPIMGVPQDNMWSGSVGFMLPVFAARRELSMGAEMDAMARASESDLRAATLDLEQQVEATHAAARAGQRIVALLADTVVTTQRRAVEASWAAYTAGAADLWRVFEATHTLYGEEVALSRARQDLARTEARLLAITARGDLLGVDLPGIQRSER
jgi:outer membrane protein TolC